MVASIESRWTSVPAGWSGHRLFDWGRGGLRSDGNVWVRAAGGPRRKTFDLGRYDRQLAVLPVGGDRRLLYRVRSLAPDEVWPVHIRAGKWWSRHHYFVPVAALQLAREQLAGERAA